MSVKAALLSAALGVAMAAGLWSARDDLTLATAAHAAETVVRAPPPEIDVPATPGVQTAIFAGGCFWGVEGVFAHVKGVRSVQSGYHGGSARDATYARVSDGDTGHAEAVRVTYDPRVVSYGTLMRIFFSVIADPTTLNRQGPDSGTQYRSALVPTTPAQGQAARAYLTQMAASGLWRGRIVTSVERYARFYPAETYHQDFFERNPRHPYILRWDRPKLAAFRRLYPQYYREKPSS